MNGRRELPLRLAVPLAIAVVVGIWTLYAAVYTALGAT